MIRPGRRVEMFGASLTEDGGEVLMRAQGWRLRTEAVSFEPPPGHRFVSGAFMETGPATVWMRMGVPLVPDEPPAPLQRVLVAADSGNGVSAALDWRHYLFINVDLGVHLHRMPEGEWICLDAVTLPEPSGIGMADTLLHDERGAIGRAAQTLLIDER